jgi:hypothetical protein
MKKELREQLDDLICGVDTESAYDFSPTASADAVLAWVASLPPEERAEIAGFKAVPPVRHDNRRLWVARSTEEASDGVG